MRNTIKNNIWKYLERALLAICIITYVVGIFWQKQRFEIIVGAIGLIYCIRYFIVFCKPIKRDWLLTRGNFLGKVINFVLFIPVTITAIVHLVNIAITDKHCAKEDYHCLSSKELVYEDNLYKEEYSGIDTLGVITCNEEGKSCTILKQSNLPDSIKEKQEDPSLLWTVYYHFIDPGNQHMTTTHRGRIISGIIATLGFLLLNGLLISMLISWIDRRREQWLKGEVKYKRFLRRAKKKFYIVIGGNDVAIGIVSELFVNNKVKKLPYIVIQTLRDVESFRRELFSGLTEEQQKHIIIYYGNRTSKDDIAYLHIENAIEVFVIGEDTRTDDIESYHDTMNMKCLRLINDEIKNSQAFKKGEKLVCRVMFEYQTSFNVLQVTDINVDKIKFLPFNYYEMWAQNVLVCQELKGNCKYLPLEGFDGIKPDDNNFVHLVIVGMSRMGVAMAIEAAHLCHYPNYENKQIRTKITFIDKNAAEEKNFFIGRFKELFALSHWRYGNINENGVLEWNPQDIHIPTGFEYLGGDFLDIEWEFINGSVENPAIQKYLEDASRNMNAKMTIAICLPENSRAIAAATYLPRCIYEETSTQQVLVYQRLDDELLNQINYKGRYSEKLRAFGMAKKCYNLSLTEMAESISKEVDKAYDQFVWEQMKKRYKKLTDEDYDKISNGYYSISSDKNKEKIKKGCDEWIKENRGKINYSEVKKSFENPRANMYKTNDKPKSAKMWSNQYNIYSMFSKFRCFGTDPSKGFEGSMMKKLGEVEHNRWVLEQLLLRYRPLTYDEQMKAKITDLYSSAMEKNRLKKNFAHLDICSNSKLKEIDCNVMELDETLIKVLPTAYTSYLKDSNKQ